MMDLNNFFRNSLDQTESAARQLTEIFENRREICTKIGAGIGLTLGSIAVRDATRMGGGSGDARQKLTLAGASVAVGFLGGAIACELLYAKIADFINESEQNSVGTTGEYGHNLTPEKKAELQEACAKLLRLYNWEADRKFWEAYQQGRAV